jgi:cbb3-type cytochrome oxidase subunit 3
MKTMSNLFEFGEQVTGYEVRVLNERAVRASAGMLFLFAIIAFMNAWLMGNFQPTRIFVVAFLFDFTIRIFINPRYAPSLIIGQWIVRHQQPEYVGAPQKRFAWTIGFALALAMLYLLVINHVIGPINLIVCSACLILLFFESAFGICIGCKIYNLFNREKAQLCPGGACEIPAAKNSGLSLLQIGTLALFIVLIGVTSQWVYRTDNQNQRHEVQNNLPAPTAAAAAVDPAEVERCKVPDFAKAMGHEEKWKLHNNCK